MGVLDGKVTIVTGASKAIGAGVATGLGESDAAVAVNCATSRERQEFSARLHEKRVLSEEGSKPRNSDCNAEGQTSCPKVSLRVLATTFVALVIAGSGAVAHLQTFQLSASESNELTQTEIARALSAAPPDVAKAATVADVDREGKMTVLRAGTNGFTCMPGDPTGVGQPAMCEDEASMQWSMDFAQHKPKPSNTFPGITYMLAGATQRSDSDPYDTTSKPIAIGPHWMIMWPFDPKTTGLPTTHKPTGAYIMWAGTPYAHLHVMGRP